MPVDVQGTFASQKINKVRWIPEEYTETKYFFTGSWDDEVNCLKVWCIEKHNEDDDIEYPQAISEYKLNGDVTEIKFVENNRIVLSSSDGDVRPEHCSCTSVDVLEGDIVTAGEDGHINMLSSRRGEVAHSIIEADSCSIHSICYLKQNEIITGNVRGHMKLWDLRSPQKDKYVASFLLNENQQAATCIVHHPTQPHIVLAGSEEGELAVWDLRINTFPASAINTHSGSINEMHFHPDNPQKLLICSGSGNIWENNMEMMIRTSKNKDNQSVTTWMQLEDKNKIVVNSLMPNLHKSINTLDIDRSRILCGADNEAVYILRNYAF
ncbi:Nucleoporin Nup43 [Eumeta japonica]|uniref:Nucleoporin Nup43 n=1 Tax=Eumeta variegata TaxID=151549 RepID=A0A4C1VX65_EUMVA|nr:Nucleoporin Nup43 [Eumeta japonica]